MSHDKHNRTANDQQPDSFVISKYQAAALNASTVIGVGVLTLPRTTSEYAQQFGWVSVLIALILTLFGVWMIHQLTSRFAGKTIVEILQTILGSQKSPWIGRLLSLPLILVYFVYWCWLTAMVVRTFGEVLVTAVLVNTPLEVIVVTMILLCLYLCYYNAEVVVRINEVLLVVIVVPVLVIALSAYQTAHFDFILPLFSIHHMSGVLMGALPAMTAFLGFESMVMFGAHLPKDRSMLRPQLYGILIAGFLYLLIVIGGIMAFGFEELSHQTWPTLELVKTTQVPGLVLERLEAVFLSVWVAAVFTSAGNWFFCANWLLNRFFKPKNKFWWSPLLLAVITYLIAMYPRNVLDLFHYLTWSGYMGLVAILGIPALCLLIAMLRRLDQRENQSGEEDERAAS